LLLYHDYFSQLKYSEDEDTVGSDGYFELNLQTKVARPLFLKIGNLIGKIYVRPDYVYGVTFPGLPSKINYDTDAEVNVDIGIIGNDSTELNALIIDYNNQYDALFLKSEEQFLSRQKIIKRIDSLTKICQKRYKKNSDAYFKSYVAYSLASLNVSVGRGMDFMVSSYFQNKPIEYNHFEYAELFNSSFKGYLSNLASMKSGRTLYNIINVQASYSMLDGFAKSSKYLQNDTLRELVIIRNLWDFYYSAEFVPEAVVNIIGQIHRSTQIEEHKSITTNMLLHLSKMRVGDKAPEFLARTKTGTVSNSSLLKNQWVYLNFFATSNMESLREMNKIAALRKKFSDKVTFVSICVDDSVKAYTTFLKNNPKYDWTIWYHKVDNVKQTVKEAYQITGTEGYYLINAYGNLAQSPALSPSKGIEVKFTNLFRPKRPSRKIGIR
jgi:peroxiredoxin